MSVNLPHVYMMIYSDYLSAAAMLEPLYKQQLWESSLSHQTLTQTTLLLRFFSVHQDILSCFPTLCHAV